MLPTASSRKGERRHCWLLRTLFRIGALWPWKRFLCSPHTDWFCKDVHILAVVFNWFHCKTCSCIIRAIRWRVWVYPFKWGAMWHRPVEIKFSCYWIILIFLVRSSLWNFFLKVILQWVFECESKGMNVLINHKKKNYLVPKKIMCYWIFFLFFFNNRRTLFFLLFFLPNFVICWTFSFLIFLQGSTLQRLPTARQPGTSALFNGLYTGWGD